MVFGTRELRYWVLGPSGLEAILQTNAVWYSSAGLRIKIQSQDGPSSFFYCRALGYRPASASQEVRGSKGLAALDVSWAKDWAAVKEFK